PSPNLSSGTYRRSTLTGVSFLSQTCSGIIRPSFAKASIVSRRDLGNSKQVCWLLRFDTLATARVSAFDSALRTPHSAISYSPRSPLRRAQRCPFPVYLPSQFHRRPSYISP